MVQKDGQWKGELVWFGGLQKGQSPSRSGNTNIHRLGFECMHAQVMLCVLLLLT